MTFNERVLATHATGVRFELLPGGQSAVERIANPRTVMRIPPRHRGKGNKTRFGRPPKVRPKRSPNWRSRAPHAVDSPDQLDGPTIQVPFAGPCGVKAEECMYQFDQAIAEHGVRYYAESRGERFNTRYFTLVVPEKHRAAAEAAVMRMRKMKRGYWQ
jgi:hypothetical protein